ncbi:Ytp1p, partial [Sporobolomyces salmoneus]|uniref:Ytp1p n=1 Tax=Sporobolomyces salmoneus TaxID=183962 RepID=UPI00316B0EA2
MILGLNKSRHHVPFQLIVIALSLFGGNFLGHHHRGRSFHMTAHAGFASYMWWYVVLQAAIGGFLKLHVAEGTRARGFAKGVHRWVGISFPIVGWVQMVFGAIASLGFCFGGHFGQCLAHEIMGSSFILYGFIYVLMLKLGAAFLERRGWSQEFLDSTIIGVWGIVNTFTEHNFFGENSAWNHKDMQHVSLGVLWWCGGALGMWLSRNGKRSIVPALIIGMTGFIMANHGQHLEFSTTVHKAFGYSLVAAGLTRLIEICLVLHDEPTPSLSASSSSSSDRKSLVPRAFQHLPPYLLVLSGLSFMSATEEQMSWVAGSGMDSTTYVNVLFSGSFVIYLVGVGMIDFYEWTRGPTREEEARREVEGRESEEGGETLTRTARGWFENVIAGRFPGQGRRLEETRTTTATRMGDYESMPLTGDRRDSVDVRNEDESQESFELSERRRRAESGGTVFELGEEEEVDRGEDGYWKEDETRREGGGRMTRA